MQVKSLIILNGFLCTHPLRRTSRLMRLNSDLILELNDMGTRTALFNNLHVCCHCEKIFISSNVLLACST